MNRQQFQDPAESDPWNDHPNMNQSRGINSEDWFAECEQSDEEWNVFFEESVHADSG